MKALIGRKIGMTTVLQEDGVTIPVTLIQSSPMTVTQVKSLEKDGYKAVQLGYGTRKELSKPLAGHVKKAKIIPEIIKEFRVEDEQEVAVGDSFDVSEFEEGDKVKVVGVSKGKGFAGTVKRWNFRTSAESHGGNGVVRRPGSIGSMYPQKVFRGKKMAGQMGGQQVTERGLTIGLVDKENHVIGVVGSVPGPRKAVVTVEGTK